MKKTHRTAVVSVPFMIAAFFCLCGMASRSLTEISGHIEYYGNAPFATAAFKADDGTVYDMAISEDADFTLNDILALQGHHLRLDGTVSDADSFSLLTGASKKISIHAYQDRSGR